MNSLFKCSTHGLHLYCIYKPEAKWRLLGCQSALQACQFLTLGPPLRKVSGFLKALLRRNWDQSSGSTDTILKWTSAYFWNMILKIYISKLSFMVPYSEYWFDHHRCYVIQPLVSTVALSTQITNSTSFLVLAMPRTPCQQFVNLYMVSEIIQMPLWNLFLDPHF